MFGTSSRTWLAVLLAAVLAAGAQSVAAGAFTTVRLPVRWSNHAAPAADATLDEVFAARVNQVVDALLD